MASHLPGPEPDPATGEPASAARSTSASVLVRLSIMMLLEFVVFGSWYATLGLVLGSNGLASIIGVAFSLGALAAIFSPMLLGAVADRFFPSQKLLAVVHAVGSLLLLAMPFVVGSGNGAMVLALVLVYMLLFQPTLGLTNSIAFRHLGDDQRLFPYVRVFGTLGWIVAGLLVGWAGLSASTGVFVVAAVAGFVLAVYSLTLPHTPPVGDGDRFSIGDVVGAKAFALFRHRNFVIFTLCALLTSVSVATYNAYASSFLAAVGIDNVAGVLAIGQISEVVFIVTIPFVLTRLGMKWALLGGMVMWGVRFVLFILSAGDLPWLAVLGVALHGICNDFFLILGAMYVDRVAPVRLAAQAQTFFVLVSSGIGVFLGSLAAGLLYNAVVAPAIASGSDDLTGWSTLWLLPIGASVVTAVLWITLFREREHPETPDTLRSSVADGRA